MKVLLPFLAALFLFSATGLCVDPREKLADALMVQMEKMANSMLAITDAATTKKAVQDLSLVAEEVSKLAVEAKTLGEPKPEVKSRVIAKLRIKKLEIQKRMAGVGLGDQLRRAGPETLETIESSLAKLHPVMQDALNQIAEVDMREPC